MATETLDDKKPEEEEVIDKENEEGSKEVLEKQMEVKKKKNEEEEEEEEEEEKRGRRKKKRKEPVTPSSDRPTREKKVVERYSAPSVAWSSSSKTQLIEKSHGTQLKDIPNGIHLLSCLFVFPLKGNWTWEHAKLKDRMETLQRDLRHYEGEDIQNLSLRELQNLEQQLDSALKRIRSNNV
ncbi:DEK domain-containing chromatin-associated protein 2-like [Gossypium arboreum]|uniref:DEK domain-containing chromatin-associated protein 2-like n=1 Tax=Gossypium arboreum TaxID=29729 RepID=UPI000818FB00|nr:DEK domain-containing chromatin-associated protein 2-like [Gossypium arboreum]